MADYEKRLQRLEERAAEKHAAATGQWPYPYVTREMIEERTAALEASFTPEERAAFEAEIAADPEGSKAAVQALLDRARAECRRLGLK